jgi:hypothetical protein
MLASNSPTQAPVHQRPPMAKEAMTTDTKRRTSGFATAPGDPIRIVSTPEIKPRVPSQDRGAMIYVHQMHGLLVTALHPCNVVGMVTLRLGPQAEGSTHLMQLNPAIDRMKL